MTIKLPSIKGISKTPPVSIPTVKVPKVKSISTVEPMKIEKVYKRIMLGNELDRRLGAYVCFNCFEYSFNDTKCKYCGREMIYQGGFEQGLNMYMGPPGSGKTTLCLQVALTALKQGLKVVYYDLEGGVRIPRIIQMYNAMGRPFPPSRIKNVFYSLKKVDFEKFYNEVIYTIEEEKPDVLIIDPLSPIMIGHFIEDKFEGEGKKSFDIWQRRYLLAYKMQKLCLEHGTVGIVTSHLGSKIREGGAGLRVEDVLESNLGAPFAHQAKLHLYLGYFSYQQSKNQPPAIFRGMVLLKHRFLPTPLTLNQLKLDDIIRFEITSGGIKPK